MGCGAPSVMFVPLIWISSGDSGPSAMAIIISSRFGSADPGENLSPGCKATTTHAPSASWPDDKQWRVGLPGLQPGQEAAADSDIEKFKRRVRLTVPSRSHPKVLEVDCSTMIVSSPSSSSSKVRLSSLPFTEQLRSTGPVQATFSSASATPGPAARSLVSVAVTCSGRGGELTGDFACG